MACNLINEEWNSLDVDEIRLGVNPAGDYQLVLKKQDIQDQLIPIEDGAPVAVRHSGGESGMLQKVETGWGEECEAQIRTFELNPAHSAGGFVVRKDGCGIGISDIRDDGLRVMQINLQAFPVVFERVDSKVVLHFKDELPSYYVSPKF